jgi:cation transport ATPase
LVLGSFRGVITELKNFTVEIDIRYRRGETKADKLQQKRSNGVKDWLLYVAIAFLIVILVWAFAFHQAKTGGSPKLPLKWLDFAAMTAVVFGYAIRACRRLWRKQKFWLVLAVFFAVHCICGVFALKQIEVVPLAYFPVLIIVEYAILSASLGFFLN